MWTPSSSFTNVHLKPFQKVVPGAYFPSKSRAPAIPPTSPPPTPPSAAPPPTETAAWLLLDSESEEDDDDDDVDDELDEEGAAAPASNDCLPYTAPPFCVQHVVSIPPLAAGNGPLRASVPNNHIPAPWIRYRMLEPVGWDRIQCPIMSLWRDA